MDQVPQPLDARRLSVALMKTPAKALSSPYSARNRIGCHPIIMQPNTQTGATLWQRK